MQTYRLLARGEPAAPVAIADAASVPLEQAEQSLHSWPGTFFDGAGRVVGFWGLTVNRLEPTHQIDVDGRTVYGWCAWDTLFLTHALGTQTAVESTDPQSGETVRLTVTPEGVGSHHPEGAVVSFLLPNGPFGPDLVQSFCHYVHFFASPESARRWAADHPGTFLLSVDEAFELGRLTNQLRIPDALKAQQAAR